MLNETDIGLLNECKEQGLIAPITGSDSNEVINSKRKLESLGYIDKNKNSYKLGRKGYEYFEPSLKEEQGKVVINSIGINNGSVVQGDSFDNALIKPEIQNKVNHNANKPTKRSVIEIVSWIVGIAVGLITLYELVIKKFI